MILSIIVFGRFYRRNLYTYFHMYLIPTMKWIKEDTIKHGVIPLLLLCLVDCQSHNITLGNVVLSY